MKFRTDVKADKFFRDTIVSPPPTLQLPEVVPYCSLLMTHAVGEKFKAVILEERKASCIGIGIQSFNPEAFGTTLTNLLDAIVSPDMSYFGKYNSDIIKLAYSHMHPLTHWNEATEDEFAMEVCPSSDYEDRNDGVYTSN